MKFARFCQALSNWAGSSKTFLLAIVLIGCSGLMKPDTHLGENARQIEVSDDQTTPLLFR